MQGTLQFLADNPTLLGLLAGLVATALVALCKRMGWQADADMFKKWATGGATGAVVYALAALKSGVPWGTDQWFGLVAAVIAGSGIYQAKKVVALTLQGKTSSSA